MNIKEEIGKRIYMERKAKELTRKALAELTDDLKPSRINNWERGERTPGPEEIKQLAKALEVAPAWLMCLTEDKGEKKQPPPFVLVPLLDHKQACQSEEIIAEIKGRTELDIPCIAISTTHSPNIENQNAFALQVIDDNMLPEFRVKDILVISPETAPTPGDFVAVHLKESEGILIYQYKKLSYSSADFELISLNCHWPNIHSSESSTINIIGRVIVNIRNYCKSK